MALPIELQRDDSGWVAKTPAMPEITGRGATQEEARDDARRKAALQLTAQATVTEKHGFFFLHCESMDVSNQGETLEEAKEGLEETLFLYLSDD